MHFTSSTYVSYQVVRKSAQRLPLITASTAPSPGLDRSPFPFLAVLMRTDCIATICASPRPLPMLVPPIRGTITVFCAQKRNHFCKHCLLVSQIKEGGATNHVPVIDVICVPALGEILEVRGSIVRNSCIRRNVSMGWAMSAWVLRCSHRGPSPDKQLGHPETRPCPRLRMVQTVARLRKISSPAACGLTFPMQITWCGSEKW